MTSSARYRNSVTVTLAAMVLVAWATLWWLDTSPWGSLFHAHAGPHAHHSAHNLSEGIQATLFVAGWTLMVVAMMLPATFPLIEVFRRLVRRKPESSVLVSLLVLGYIVTWAFFGLLIYGATRVLASVPLPAEGPMMPAILFLLAGSFQFSSLKYRCLDRCRAPLGFVLARWPGRTGHRVAAFRIGIHHGAFCVGCCWALMLLMFAFATANLLWMLFLGILMSVEKNAPWGRQMGKPVGFALLAVGGGLLLSVLNGS